MPELIEIDKQGSQGWPIIDNIEECIKVIGDSKEFNIINDKKGFIYISYRRVTSTTFPSPITTINDLIRRELRGLAFHSTNGKLISRSLHKFFNINEKKETDIETIQNRINFDLKNGKKIYLLDKLDGSLVMPLLVEENKKRRLRFRTKQGFGHNNTCKLVEQLIYGLKNINDEIPTLDEVLLEENNFKNIILFCVKYIEMGKTPIFEFCSPEYKIVIIYDEPSLNLIAIRDTLNGDYVKVEEMEEIAKECNIPCVNLTHLNTLNGDDFNLEKVIEEIKKKENVEGCVLRLEDGEMFKIKSEWYSTIHFKKQRLEFNYINESHSWWLVLSGGVDDVLPILNSENEKEQLKQFNDDLWNVVQSFSENLKSKIKQLLKEANNNQKEFAEKVKSQFTNKTLHKLIFDLAKDIDNADEVQLTVDTLLKFINQNKVDQAREFLGTTLGYKKKLTSLGEED
ncbi:hypothetical protein ABK040_004677 [Willaertia magna]